MTVCGTMVLKPIASNTGRAVILVPWDGAAGGASVSGSVKNKRHNGFSFDLQLAAQAVLGLDVTKINGFGLYVALKLLGECGTDMSRWPSAKHFTSWLCLFPGNKISGGKCSPREPAAH